MKQGYRKGIIHSNIQIATNIYEIKLSPCHPESDSISLTMEESGFQGKPGQFYMLRGWELDPLLPRPISICDISDGIITFLYEVRGRGTHIISKLKKGDTLELLGPLGNGFDLNIEDKIAIVSGGIGVAPLIYLMKGFKGDMDFYCGFRNEAYYLDEIREHVDNTHISTEDGSVGHRGFVTDLFLPKRYDMVLTCGPIPMMNRVVEMCKDKNVPVYVSMESRMACGIGTCLGCTIETTSGMKRVCKEGPVFSGEEVKFND
ncbi:MAG: dihydroorotate dehydrogenase electron transfer subunit [Tissierellia bacterium]|nr:dihydroorotate dehydrogenase electron transfer subunit [Tissierellia bacterium]